VCAPQTHLTQLLKRVYVSGERESDAKRWLIYWLMMMMMLMIAQDLLKHGDERHVAENHCVAGERNMMEVIAKRLSVFLLSMQCDVSSYT
jgi:hypothetical protein